jgi:Flp pilus assembly protein TadG
MRTRGQAIVEFALMLPMLLSILLAIAGMAYLIVSRHDYQNGADVLVVLASDGTGSWHSAVAGENDRTNCHATSEPELTYPDRGASTGQVIQLTWTCYFRYVAPFDNLPVTVRSEAVLRPTPTPTPAPEPTVAP